jgi:hypothetical protein
MKAEEKGKKAKPCLWKNVAAVVRRFVLVSLP